MYRPTREGDFLQDLLKDFHGVLVSDFYAAYDSIECPQQKCLIHLMRDMNQELLSNPFDEELQSITRPFGTLLRAVVETIDQHGLKRRALEEHKRDVDGFFEGLAGRTFRSEAAEALRSRLLKYRDKLFTFIEHDGVPWNNNNAENAIKRFAYYREDHDRNAERGGVERLFGASQHLPDVPLQGSQLPEVPGVGAAGHRLFLRGEAITATLARNPTLPEGFVPPYLKSRSGRKGEPQSDKSDGQAQ